MTMKRVATALLKMLTQRLGQGGSVDACLVVYAVSFAAEPQVNVAYVLKTAKGSLTGGQMEAGVMIPLFGKVRMSIADERCAPLRISTEDLQRIGLGNEEIDPAKPDPEIRHLIDVHVPWCLLSRAGRTSFSREVEPSFEAGLRELIDAGWKAAMAARTQ